MRYLSRIFLIAFCALFLSTADANQVDEGQSIAKKSLCLGCHAIDKKVVGPSFTDIAKRYASHPEAKSYLSQKILNGGSGVWGVVAMPSNKNTINATQTYQVVDWIMSLNQKRQN